MGPRSQTHQSHQESAPSDYLTLTPPGDTRASRSLVAVGRFFILSEPMSRNTTKELDSNLKPIPRTGRMPCAPTLIA